MMKSLTIFALVLSLFATELVHSGHYKFALGAGNDKNGRQLAAPDQPLPSPDVRAQLNDNPNNMNDNNKQNSANNVVNANNNNNDNINNNGIENNALPKQKKKHKNVVNNKNIYDYQNVGNNNNNNPNLNQIPSNYNADWTKFSLEGFWPSLSMILVSEIGDKTFFIAAILAMKHSRFVVWFGAFGALFVMTVLAVVFGSMLQVIPASITHYGAGLLFLIFGIKLLWESRSMKGGEASDELREAEEELLESERKAANKEKEKQINNDIELGHTNNNNSNNSNNSKNNDTCDDISEYKKEISKGFDINILIRSFGLTFISEIGDRSQITTVVLAAHRNPYGVTVGASLGHGICTLIAVLGGRLIAAKISERNITLLAGFLFLAFSLECFIYGPVE